MIKTVIKKLPIALTLVFGLLVLAASPAYAIEDPTSISLTTPIQVYHNLLETGDTLFIVKYNVVYPVEGNPDEKISEAYLGILLDESDEQVGATSPYAFWNEGYGYGIFSLYFSSGEVTWEEDYKIQLVGNPGLSWDGDPPIVIATSLNWNSTNSGLGNYVLTLADELEVAWDINLVETTSSGIKLSSTYGEAYFTTAIPNLRLVAPEVFATSMEVPQFVVEEHPRIYMEQLLDRWVGTEYDEAFTDLATYFSLPRAVLTGGFFFILAIVGSFLIMRSTHTAKPLPLFIIILLILGALSGFLSALVPILMAVGTAIFIGYILFYRTST